MNKKVFKRILSSVLTLGMVASMMPASVMAATEVTTSPGSTKLNVEYFNSTLYNWNEDAANAATAAADITGGTVSYKTVYQYAPATTITSGKQYLLVSGRTGYLLGVTTGTRSGATGVAFTSSNVGTAAFNSDNSLNNYLYTITASGDNYTVKNANGQYLTVSNNAAGFSSTETQLVFGSYGSYFDISNVVGSGAADAYTEVSFNTSNYSNYANGSYYYKTTDGNYYVITRVAKSGSSYYIYYNNNTSKKATNGMTLYQKGSSSSTPYYLNNFGGDNTIAAGWTDNASADSGSRWALMEYTGTAKVEVTSGGSQAGKGFYFTNGGNKASSVPSFSMWSGNAQNYHIYSGLAAAKLGESSNAPFSANVNAADLFCNNGDNSYTTRYTNVPVPFVYEDGYYYLDSDKYAVYMNDVSNATNYGHTFDGNTMSIADKPAYTSDNGVAGAGFQPFAKITSSTSSINTTKRDGSSVSAYNTSGNQVFGFGMVTNVDFQMTDDGKDANGDPIQFKFCGDDDVWVYVDGKLVLDIGGTHDAITGTIDFVTGDVTLDALNYDTVGDKAVCRTGTATGFGSCSTHTSQTISQTNMYTTLGTTLTGFSAAGQHTLTIYYMDRGKGKTNCLIKFNLPQRDTLSVTKDFTQSKTPEGVVSEMTAAEQEKYNNVPFGFTLRNGDGTVVANKSYYIYENGAATGKTASTDAKGHFTLTNGQTAKFNVSIKQDGSSYYVVEDTLDATAYCTPAYVVNGGSLTGGYTSPAPVMKGDDTRADEYTITCYNYMNSNIPNPYVMASDDTIVLDYGLPVEINVDDLLKNDIHRGDTFEMIGLYTSAVVPTENAITPVNSVSGQYGDAEYADGKITYTLNKEFKGIDTIYYVAKATGIGNVGTQEVTKSYYATGAIKIIPATSVYYEDNFNALFTKVASGVTTVGTAKGDIQETGIVGTATDSTYGSDVCYLNETGDSNGTVKSFNTTNSPAGFVYNFTGTGTAVYARISKTTGYLQVVLKNLATGHTDTNYVDTAVLAGAGGFNSLYNIPVYQENDLEYGDYQVTVSIAKAGTTTREGNGKAGAEFYLDGIRVYEPMGDNATAQAAYAADGEANVVVANIAPVSADNNAGEFATLTDINGNIVELDEYEGIGPDNELYLREGYTVSFEMAYWDSQMFKLFLGMKLPEEETGSVKVGNTTYSVKNTTDCYYDISNDIEVVQNDGINVGTVTITGISGTVALTNLKVTGDDSFVIIEAENGEGFEDIVVDGDEGEGADNSGYFLSLAPAGTYTSNQQETEEIVKAFVPEYVQIANTYAKSSKKATVTAKCSADVVSATINGEATTMKTLAGYHNFTASFKKIAKGTEMEVVLYNAEGVASEPYYITIK